MRRGVLLAVLLALAVSGCSDPESERVKETTKPTYDAKTGKLTQLTYDRNKDGIIDTWTDMDGTRPLRSRIDLNQDGRIDRWEYYDERGKLTKVGFSRRDDGRADAWAYPDVDGKIALVESSSKGDEKKIDRWEHYDAATATDNPDDPGVLISAEEDTIGDGHPHKWETYIKGQLHTVAFDELGDGKPDRRLTYANGQLVLIESEPDPSGSYTKKVVVR